MYGSTASGSYSLSTALFHDDPWAKGSDMNVPFGAELSTESYTKHVDQVWVSMLNAMYSLKKLF